MLGYRLDNIHPLLIHFPIALLITSWVCDVLGTLFRRESLYHGGWWCMVFGIISLPFTIATGFFADTVVGHLDNPFPIFQTHGIVQIINSFTFTGLFIWKVLWKGKLPERKILFLYHFMGGIAVIMLIYGSHLGAKLAGRI